MNVVIFTTITKARKRTNPKRITTLTLLKSNNELIHQLILENKSTVIG